MSDKGERAELERKAWAELALHLSARSGGFAAIARQEGENAARLQVMSPPQAEIHRLSAAKHAAAAKAAGELETIAKDKAAALAAEGTDEHQI